MQQEKQLIKVLPEFVNHLITALQASGRGEIADQLSSVHMRHSSYDKDADAGYLRVTESRPLNIVEQNVIGCRHGECVTLDKLPGMVVIDLDNFGRVQGIELLGHAEVFRRIGHI
ncbi:MAG: DUF2283 domain-containing protein [Planctomycetota bacterium]|nr:DUF2283 domain-containing protein [Planctomycetota bacterium]